MSIRFENFIAELEKNLSKDLPGIDAHKLMMPEGRKFDISSANTPTKSAVMILLYENNNQVFFNLILRAKYNGHHSGQMALPGGKHEINDSSLIETALRETEEEIGINSNSIYTIGTMSELYIPITNILVQPVIGYLNHKPDFTINKHEVDTLFEININDIINPLNKEYEHRNINGDILNIPFYNLQSQKVWGATAMILSEFEIIINKINHLN